MLFTIENELDSLQKIQGLRYVPCFLSEEEEAFYLACIEENVWLEDLKRKVQHYGYKYDYKARFIDYSMNIGALPAWAQALAEKLYKEGIVSELPDQLIVNAYQAGQGISHHIDCEPCFGEEIVSISLGSDCVMEFIHLKSKEKVPILLHQRSLVLLQGEARHLWAHGIAGRKKDQFQGVTFPRNTRISLTFRKVKLGNSEQ